VIAGRAELRVLISQPEQEKNSGYSKRASTPDTTGINRWWRVVGGLSMNIALGTLYAWSVFVAPLEKEFGWKRAETSNVFTMEAVVCANICRGGAPARQVWPVVGFPDRRRIGEPGFLLACLHPQSELPVCLLRRDWWVRKRIWLLHAHPGNGQMVSRQTWLSHWTGGRRLRSGLGAVWAVGQPQADSCLWSAPNVYDSGSHFPGHDGFRCVPAA
jgi:hypothetical protein